MAELRVYGDAPGTVVRCPACEAVLMRIVRRTDGATLLDLSGIRSLRLG